jgi:hypothetical protein
VLQALAPILRATGATKSAVSCFNYQVKQSTDKRHSNAMDFTRRTVTQSFGGETKPLLPPTPLPFPKSFIFNRILVKEHK